MADDSGALVIAVDGPVAAGKGTLARSLAKAFGLRYLDTGSLYRAVGARGPCRVGAQQAYPIGRRQAWKALEWRLVRGGGYEIHTEAVRSGADTRYAGYISHIMRKLFS